MAQMVSLSLRTIRSLQGKGLPHIRVGRRVLFDPIRVKAWLEQRADATAQAEDACPGSEATSEASMIPESARRRPGRPRRIVL